jgi:hypothetical protein
LIDFVGQLIGVLIFDLELVMLGVERIDRRLLPIVRPAGVPSTSRKPLL